MQSTSAQKCRFQIPPLIVSVRVRVWIDGFLVLLGHICVATSVHSSFHQSTTVTTISCDIRYDRSVAIQCRSRKSNLNTNLRIRGQIQTMGFDSHTLSLGEIKMQMRAWRARDW